MLQMRIVTDRTGNDKTGIDEFEVHFIVLYLVRLGVVDIGRGLAKPVTAGGAALARRSHTVHRGIPSMRGV